MSRGVTRAGRGKARPTSARPPRQGLASTSRADGAHNPEQMVLNDFCKALEDHRKTCEATCKCVAHAVMGSLRRM